MKRKNVLGYVMLMGFIYFLLVAIVHFLGIKIPILFIYYDVESYVYQDRIIAVLSFVFSMFLYSGYKLHNDNLKIVKYIIISGSVAISGLLINNFFTKLLFRNNLIYWVEIIFLLAYLIVIIFLYYRVDKK